MTVFPEPTSPWIKRFMGRSLSISLCISSSALFCAPVRGKDNLPTNSPMASPAANEIPFSSLFFIMTSPNAKINSSSKMNRYLACRSSSGPMGKWIFFRAYCSGRDCFPLPAWEEAHPQHSPPLAQFLVATCAFRFEKFFGERIYGKNPLDSVG